MEKKTSAITHEAIDHANELIEQLLEKDLQAYIEELSIKAR
jgi:hypothetical protein